jgi:hypothetical protein
MLAWGMNGQDLPWLNGYPLRLVVPGFYGTYYLHGARLHPGLVEHGLQRHAGPAGAAHGAVGELPGPTASRSRAMSSGRSRSRSPT